MKPNFVKNKLSHQTRKIMAWRYNHYFKDSSSIVPCILIEWESTWKRSFCHELFSVCKSNIVVSSTFGDWFDWLMTVGERVREPAVVSTESPVQEPATQQSVQLPCVRQHGRRRRSANPRCRRFHRQSRSTATSRRRRIIWKKFTLNPQTSTSFLRLSLS